MRVHFTVLLALILMATVPAGCKSKDPADASREAPRLVQVRSLYPEDIHLVNRIEMLRSDGERRRIDDKAVIDRWLERVGEVWVTIDPDRPDHSGSLFIVTLFENDRETFGLTPTAVDHQKIATSHELADLMRQLWDGDTQSR